MDIKLRFPYAALRFIRRHGDVRPEFPPGEDCRPRRYQNLLSQSNCCDKNVPLMREGKKTKDQLREELASLRAELDRMKSGDGTGATTTAPPSFGAELYAGIFASFPMGVSVTDKKGATVYVNPAFIEMTGYNLTEIATEKEWFVKAFPDKDCRRQALSFWVKFQTAQMPGRRIFPIACKNGRTKFLETNLVLLAGDTVVALFADRSAASDAERFPGNAEDKWRLLLDIMNEGFINVNEDGIPIFVNRRLCEMLGYESEEIIGRPLSVFLEEESFRIFQTEFSERARGAQKSYELTGMHKSGAPRHFIVSPRPLYDYSGRFAGSYGTCTDITDRKSIEEELRRSEMRYRRLAEDYRSIVDNTSEGVYRSIPAGRYIMANHAFARMLGYDSPEEFLTAVTDIRKQVYVDAGVRDEAIRQVVAAGSGELEVQAKCRDGRIVWLANSVRAVRNEKGEVNYFEGIVRDISLRKEAEQALEVSERKYRTLFNSSSVGIVVTDVSGKIREANPAWQRMTGYTEEEYRQLAPQVHYARQEDRLAVRAGLADNGMVRNYEVSLQHRDGQQFVALLNADLHELEGEKIILSQVLDVTARMKIEEALRQSEEKYRHIFDNSVLGIYQVTPGGRFISANAAAAHILGYETPAELMDAITDIRTQIYAFPEDRDRAVAIMKKEGRLHNFEARCRHKNGGMIWVLFNATPIRDKRGRIVCHDGTSQDIDERKRVEEELRMSRMRYEELLAGAREIVWETDADGRFVYLSPGVKQVLGYSPEEMLGRMPYEFFRAEDMEKFQEFTRHALDNPASFNVPEVVIIRKRGKHVAMTGNGWPFFDRRGRLKGYRGFLRDAARRWDRVIFDVGAKSPTPPRKPVNKGVPPRRP